MINGGKNCMANRTWFGWIVVLLAALIMIADGYVFAQDNEITQVCPVTGIRPRGPLFPAGGIILTSFDRSAIWVYDVTNNRRFPLPETSPCGRNCRLSPDARWITYYNRLTQAFNKMRLDGTERTLVAESANDVEWWGDDTYFVWTPAHRAYVQATNSPERRAFDVRGISAVQPNGSWAVRVSADGDGFIRDLVKLDEPNRIISLGVDSAYSNALGWSGDGARLAYVAPIRNSGLAATSSELYIVQPDAAAPGNSPVRATRLTDSLGAVRINGLSVGELSWSPGHQKIAFWVTPIRNPDPAAADAPATIHVYDVTTNEIRAYCAYSTTEHTPNPPRIVWSPDGTHLAFGGNVPDDERGYLLIAVNVESGTMIELSEGIYPTLGQANVIAWGLPPR